MLSRTLGHRSIAQRPSQHNTVTRCYSQHSGRRVVITGLGLVTPLGVGVKESWSNLVASKCAVEKVTTFDTSQLPVKIAASIPQGNNPGEYNDEDWIPKKFRSEAATFSRYAMAAAKMAMDDCGWAPQTEEERTRAGIAVGGSAVGICHDITKTVKIYDEKGFKRVSPFFLPRILTNMAAGVLSIQYGLKGPNHSCATACATGGHAIADAVRFIKYGDADFMMAGASEAPNNEIVMAGFARARALTSSFNDEPEKASRPFDKDRSGFVIGEGAGIVTLEEYEHAKKRGAHIYGEVAGYGYSGDAFHITQPHASGDGAIRAMNGAMKSGGLKPEDIGYINAHATSTPLGDRIENQAIKTVFANCEKDLYVSSTKGAIGHLQGAAGAVEAIFATLAMEKGELPPTLNLDTLEEGFTLNYIPNTAIQKQSKAVLTNSFGFGGTNCSIAIKKV